MLILSMYSIIRDIIRELIVSFSLVNLDPLFCARGDLAIPCAYENNLELNAPLVLDKGTPLHPFR